MGWEFAKITEPLFVGKMITTLLSKTVSVTLNYTPKFGSQSCRPSQSPSSSLSSRALLCLSDINIKLSYKASSKCFCNKNDNTHQASSQSFSVLAEDIPWDVASVWSTMALYMFTLHIPLSFGWKSVAARVFQQPDLDPQTQATSLLVAQLLELAASLVLLKLTAKPQYEFVDLFEPEKSSSSKERDWLLASALGFVFIFALVVITSLVLESVFGPKAVNNPVVEEILEGSNVAKTACALVYCVITPQLEEAVYRGFLLRSLSSTMKWQKAVLISSLVFSAAHLSGENFIQLFIIGCVLGFSYCWTGNLCSSFAIHSLYNSMILIITFLS